MTRISPIKAAATQVPQACGPSVVSVVVEAGRDCLLTAPADSVAPAEFVRLSRNLFSRSPTRLSERADTVNLFLMKAWGRSREETEGLRAEMNAALDAIDERYSLVFVEHLGEGRILA